MGLFLRRMPDAAGAMAPPWPDVHRDRLVDAWEKSGTRRLLDFLEINTRAR